jgi:hypothetical protein
MRPRSLTQRILTALFGLWFSLVLAEPVPLHVCPMHDGMRTHAAAQAVHTSHAATAHPVGHVGLHHAPQSHDVGTTHAPAEHEAHLCLCLGCCAGTSAVSLPASPVRNLPELLAAVQVRSHAAGERLAHAVRFAHALPFANGPPQS